MPKDNIKLGRIGEAKAITFLKSNGFNILEANYRTRFCEIDIIAKKNDFICFIEVKTRRSLKMGLPREAVNFAKQKKIMQGAQFYLKEKNLNNIRFRFDVMEVYFNDNDIFKINLIENAFWGD